MLQPSFPPPHSAKLKHPIILCILDGWGDRCSNPNIESNAFLQAQTPTWNFFEKTFPKALLNASGLAVGLPAGQMGNSEVGHLTLGAGRVIFQDLPRIDKALEEDFLSHSSEIQGLIKTLKQSGKACHLIGLFSSGGVHSHIRHLEALVTYLNLQKIPIYLHAILDGRDVPPQSALGFYKDFVRKCVENLTYPSLFHFATVSGRFYAMDRDKRWDRTEKAYKAIMEGKGPTAKTLPEVIEKAYEQNVTDEFIIPTLLTGYKGIEEKDAIFCFNFRADRVRQIMEAFLNPSFSDFSRERILHLSYAVGLTEYSNHLSQWMTVLFKPETFPYIFGEIISQKGLTQLRLAETEKYAHVTFFFNGGEEKPFVGEYRQLIPSPKVVTYDLVPEMSAVEVTDALTNCIISKQFDVYIINFANPDMVGHTGNIPAAIKAIECIDKCLKRIYDAVEATQSYLFITADHGNIELMKDPLTHNPHTAHTCFQVPFFMINTSKNWNLLPEGTLADVAPTLLEAISLPMPSAMTGHSLLQKGK